MKLNMKLHHVGYTVADIRVSAKRFALLGYQAGEECRNRTGASVASRFVRGGTAPCGRCHALSFRL